MSFDFFPNEQSTALLNAARHPSVTPDPDTFTNFLPGAASYGMRSLAEVGRAVDLAGSVFPIAVDAATGGTERQDQYFKEHDEVFNSAVDHWTPRPGEVGAAGQIAGQLAGGVMQAVISPALLVATSQLSTGEDLVRQGVDASTANTVGGIAGAGAAVGLKLPFLGKTLATRVLSGAGGNVLQGAATAEASHLVLDAAGNTHQAAQYDATDLRGRLLDAMMGAAFGGLAHIGAKLTPREDAAILVSNQARHLEETTSPGRPDTASDLTQHVTAMRGAIDQILRGDPVAVDKTIEGMHMHPDETMIRDRTELTGEMTRLAGEEVPPEETIKPIADETPLRTPEGNDPLDVQAADAVPGNLIMARSRAALAKNPDMLIPDRGADPLAEPVPTRAGDVLDRLAAERASAEATAPDLFKTAAACLLGVL
jgi:hypothetical protein